MYRVSQCFYEALSTALHFLSWKKFINIPKKRQVKGNDRLALYRETSWKSIPFTNLFSRDAE